MSEVFHAEKMVKDLPLEFRPPVVRVERELYFINELLQLRNKDYFIPTCYIRDGGTNQLYALGWQVTKTEVSLENEKTEQRTDAHHGTGGTRGRRRGASHGSDDRLLSQLRRHIRRYA